MDDTTLLNVTPTLAIPRAELQYRASRAGGPGGQHVNTSSTRIELLWDLPNSRAVSDDERDRIRTKLAARLDCGRQGARRGERASEPAAESAGGGRTTRVAGAARAARAQEAPGDQTDEGRRRSDGCRRRSGRATRSATGGPTTD